MSSWMRNLVMLVTLAVWVVVMAAYLLKGQLPDAPLLGVPGAVYLALSPSILGRARKVIPGQAANSHAPGGDA